MLLWKFCVHFCLYSCIIWLSMGKPFRKLLSSCIWGGEYSSSISLILSSEIFSSSRMTWADNCLMSNESFENMRVLLNSPLFSAMCESRRLLSIKNGEGDCVSFYVRSLGCSKSAKISKSSLLANLLSKISKAVYCAYLLIISNASFAFILCDS